MVNPQKIRSLIWKHINPIENLRGRQTMDNKLVMFVVKRTLGMGMLIALAACGSTGFATIFGILYFLSTIRAIKKYRDD